MTAPGSEVWEELRPVFRSLEHTLFFGPHRSLHHGAALPGQDTRSGAEFAERWREAKQKHPERVRGLLEEISGDLCRLFRFREFHADVDENGSVELRVDGERMGLSDLGSGIGQAFLLLAQAAAEEPDYVLIDEPECHLHPACQVDFVTLLGSHARYGVIAATHNLGLARSISEHIYEIKREPEAGAARLELLDETGGRLSQRLGELDFAAHRRMGCTKVLLVEGPRRSRRTPAAGQRGDGRSVVLLPLGGSSMINGRRADELGEIRKICPNVYALIDSERDRAGAPVSIPHREFLEACRHHGIDAHALERRSF
ncbi:MAG: AAA family ATPase [Bdellovibrionaceae bacterium]|nr:AAA family ATPase [Pseudobdellovibrionaceae bacterium]